MKSVQEFPLLLKIFTGRSFEPMIETTNFTSFQGLIPELKNFRGCRTL